MTIYDDCGSCVIYKEYSIIWVRDFNRTNGFDPFSYSFTLSGCLVRWLVSAWLRCIYIQHSQFQVLVTNHVMGCVDFLNYIKRLQIYTRHQWFFENSWLSHFSKFNVFKYFRNCKSCFNEFWTI